MPPKTAKKGANELKGRKSNLVLGDVDSGPRSRRSSNPPPPKPMEVEEEHEDDRCAPRIPRGMHMWTGWAARAGHATPGQGRGSGFVW